MTGIEFTVIGTPISKGSMKSYGRGRMVETVKKSAPWRERVHWAAKEAWPQPPLEGPIEVTAACCFDYPKSAPKRLRVPPITRSTYDVDKLARNLLDAISKVVIVDDSQVVHLDITKHYVGDPYCPLDRAGAVIRIRPYEPPNAAEVDEPSDQFAIAVPVRPGRNLVADTVNVTGDVL